MKSHNIAATAYHEAGHAVVAFYLGQNIRKVTIIPDAGSYGHVLHRRRRETTEGRGMFDKSSYKIFADIISLYAGQLAQRRFAPRSLRLHHVSTGSLSGSADNDKIVSLALRHTDNAGVPLLTAWLKHEADFLVERRWKDIRAVANALLERKTLTGDEMRDTINRLYGPLPGDRAWVSGATFQTITRT